MNKREWPVPITVETCPETGNPIVCAGKYRAVSFERIFGRKDALYEWAECRILYEYCPIAKPDMKGRNKWFSDNLGTGFFRAWNGAMWAAWVGDLRPYALKLCGTRIKGKPALSNIKITRLRQNWPLVEQCIKDGNWHIAPLVHGFGMTPHEFKEMLGKGLWKRLARNSFTRNKAIVDRLYRAEHTHVPTGEYSRQTFIKRLQAAETLPTRWMSWPLFEGPGPSPVVAWYIAECRKAKRVSKVVAMEAQGDIQHAYDAMRLAARFGEAWTECGLETMRRRHDEYTRRLNEEYRIGRGVDIRWGPPVRAIDPTPWETFGWPETLEQDGYTLTLLNSEPLLREEGQAMHHCVGSYDHRARRGEAIIYSVKYKGERVSTAEFSVAQTMTGGDWVVRQNRAVCNQDLPKQHQEPVKNILNNMAAQMNINQPRRQLSYEPQDFPWALQA